MGLLDGWILADHRASGIRHPTYRKGTGPGVIVIHEVPGLTLARPLACEAGIIPAVLGGKSQVLDLGRSKRFHTKAQRIVATIEQGGCLREGCDAPPAMTQMHHPIPWAQGGRTGRDGWMLCPPDHRRAHDPRYRHERLSNGKIAFHRRT